MILCDLMVVSHVEILASCACATSDSPSRQLVLEKTNTSEHHTRSTEQ